METHLLPWYFASKFPYDVYARWLSWDRRIIALTNADDGKFSRHTLKSADEFRQLVQSRKPLKIDIGPYGDQSSSRELVFDLDITDFSDVSECADATCASVICAACWTRFMIPSMEVIDKALRDDFLLTKIMWIFSGRKGVQCIVWDDEVLALDDMGRTAFADYLTIHPSTRDRHPSIVRAQEILKKHIRHHPVYPIIDRAVTTQTRHLLKAVFSPHPTSGYIALPLLSLTAPRPLVTLGDLETLANNGRLDAADSVWTRHIQQFKTITATTSKPRKRLREG